MPEIPLDNKRVLIWCVNWLGDALLTTAVPPALKENFKGLYLAVVVKDYLREVFSDNPFVDEVIVFDEKGRQKSLIEKIKFISYLNKKKFDVVFLIKSSLTRSLICFFAGIKYRVGWQSFKTFSIINYPVKKPEKVLPREDEYNYLFKARGIKIKKKKYFFIPQEAENNIENLLGKIIKENIKGLIVVSPACGWHLKQWPVENFSWVCNKFIEEGYGVIVVGRRKDEPLCSQLNKLCGNKLYNLCARTNLKELGALLKKVRLFIGNDSGVGHLSAILGKPTLLLFGPTSADLTAPRADNVYILEVPEVDLRKQCRRPCYNLNCQDNICMKKITPERVFLRAREILDKLYG